ncbi:MAG TPA: transposase [Pirellulaceae bacterium]|nr:transposase [Pirellulaceae bacterium]
MQDQLTNGDLPHWFRPGFAHFVTFRLANTLPITVLHALQREREERLLRPPPLGTDLWQHRANIHKRIFARYDELLDQSKSTRWLSDERVATMIRDSLYHLHGQKYELLAYTIMPNHVHVLLQPFASAMAVQRPAHEQSRRDEASLECPDSTSPLTKIMHSLKSFTANRANELLGRTGRFWQKESYDHWVRDTEELERIANYIAANPVNAGLCSSPREWRFSSAHDRYERDQSECALVGWLRDDWQDK